MVEIVSEGNSVLREKAEEVPLFDITSPRIRKIIKEMSKTLARERDGVALAAPQIGESLQIFIVSGNAQNIGKGKPREIKKDLVFINPKLTKLSREKKNLPEGCLSVRFVYGEVARSVKAEITAYDENGKKTKKGVSGLMAQIFQHECDHLEGILFVDKAKKLERISKEEFKKLTHEE